MLVSPIMRASSHAFALFFLALGTSLASEQPPQRYRVEYTVVVETSTATPRRALTRTVPEPITTRVEGRAAFTLTRTGEREWRIGMIDLGPMRVEPSVRANAPAAVALAAALVAFQQQADRDFTGGWDSLPVLALEEGEGGWQTAWLQWAKAGLAAPENNPVRARVNELLPAVRYARRTLRTEFRGEVCWVLEIDWLLPARPAPAGVSPELSAEGVEARMTLAAKSLEWVGQQSGALIYAERNLVREISWDVEKVSSEQLKDVPFRYRLGVTLRVERLP